jgi:hypothetical protein
VSLIVNNLECDEELFKFKTVPEEFMMHTIYLPEKQMRFYCVKLHQLNVML